MKPESSKSTVRNILLRKKMWNRNHEEGISTHFVRCDHVLWGSKKVTFFYRFVLKYLKVNIVISGLCFQLFQQGKKWIQDSKIGVNIYFTIDYITFFTLTYAWNFVNRLKNKNVGMLTLNRKMKVVLVLLIQKGRKNYKVIKWANY